MTDEPVGTMRAAIQSAIEDFLARKGGGFQTAFVFAVDVVDTNGEACIYLGGPAEQDALVPAAIARWEDKGPTSLTVALMAEALYAVRDKGK